MTDPTFYDDLPPEAFPIVAEFLRDGVVVHRIDIPGPGVVVVPDLTFEGLVGVRMTFGDGRVEEYEPPP